jgi:hypothetical protein
MPLIMQLRMREREHIDMHMHACAYYEEINKLEFSGIQRIFVEKLLLFQLFVDSILFIVFNFENSLMHIQKQNLVH